MFDVSWTEIMVVAVVAIIVVGPKELPAMLRAFGKTFGQVRRTAREFQSTFNDALREAERQAALDDVKKDLDGIRKLDPTKDIRKSLSDTKRALNDKVTDTAAPKSTSPKSGDGAAEAVTDDAASKAAPAASAPSQPAPATAEPAPEQTDTASSRKDEDADARHAAAGADGR